MAETVTMKGQPFNLKGSLPKEGSKLADFELTDPDLKTVKISDFKGKPLLLITVPSLDTSVCSLETRRFNEKIEKLKEQIHTVVISMDLPFAQKRFCTAENVKNVKTFSDFKNREAGEKLGVYIEGLGLLARAIFVCDPNLIVKKVFLVKEITQEPDYDKVLQGVQQLLSGVK